MKHGQEFADAVIETMGGTIISAAGRGKTANKCRIALRSTSKRDVKGWTWTVGRALARMSHLFLIAASHRLKVKPDILPSAQCIELIVFLPRGPRNGGMYMYRGGNNGRYVVRRMLYSK